MHALCSVTGHCDHRRTTVSKSQPDPLPELFMKVRDPQYIVKLMDIQEVSLRDLSRSAGWKSHTYLIRILRGEIKSVQPKPAARIARRLGVGIDDLFLTRLSSDTAQSSKRKSAA